MGCGAQTAAQGGHAAAQEHFYTGSLTVIIHFALTREQAARVKSKESYNRIRHSGWGMEARFHSCQDTLSLLEALRALWVQRPQSPEFQKPFFLGVVMGSLVRESEHQAELFTDPANRAQLSATMDKLNLKYGHTTLHFAGMLPARESAPTRIAFTQIPVQYGVEFM